MHTGIERIWGNFFAIYYNLLIGLFCSSFAPAVLSAQHDCSFLKHELDFFCLLSSKTLWWLPIATQSKKAATCKVCHDLTPFLPPHIYFQLLFPSLTKSAQLSSLLFLRQRRHAFTIAIVLLFFLSRILCSETTDSSSTTFKSLLRFHLHEPFPDLLFKIRTPF